MTRLSQAQLRSNFVPWRYQAVATLAMLIVMAKVLRLGLELGLVMATLLVLELADLPEWTLAC